MSSLRPRRSVLYMPAANERALEKAKTIAADAIIFDLEDAVAPDAKEAARENAVAAATSGDYGRRELTIRCNGLDTPWGAADIAAAAGSSAAAVVIPKVISTDHLNEVDAQLRAAAHPRVNVLVMGTNDLIKELRAEQHADRAPLIPHLAMALLGAREADKVILDGVYNDVKNPEGFLAEAQQGRAFGFDGKTLIHPTQVEPANDVWAPSEADIDYSQRVIEAFDEAVSEGRGVITVDGRMIENLHVDNARRVLATAAAIAELNG